MKKNIARLLASLSMASLGMATAAHAQDAAADNGGIQEIIVTAQKRAENLQDVPISVAAVTAQAVEDLHATTLQGLKGSVPNVEIGNFSNTPNTAVYTIRGIGVIEPDPYAGNTVGIVVDNVPQYFSMGALVDLYDVERIEVLRGPQGTLFGANTTGGVVNVVNADPKREFGGKVDLSYGNYHHFQAGGVLNVPLGEDLAGRFVISHDQRDGWVTNVVNGNDLGKRNVTIFRGALKYAPAGSHFDATFTGEYDRSRNGSPIVVAGDYPGEAEFVPAGFRNMYQSPCLPVGSRCRAPDHYYSSLGTGPVDANGNQVDPLQDRSEMDTYRATLAMNLRDTAIGDITSITGYKRFKLFEYTDQDGTPIFLDDTRRTTKGWQFSQELRTSVNLTDHINVIVGGFYLKDHFSHEQDLRINFGGGVTYDPATGSVTYGLPGLFQLNRQNQDNYSISGFAQSYIKLTGQLRIQAGIRYTHEQTKMLASTITSLSATGVTTFDGTDENGNPNAVIGTVAPPLGVKSWNNIGWKLGVDYKPIDGMLLYGYWARGFKSGGFTGRIGIDSDLGPYNPEHVDTFEAGLKADFFDRHLRTNLAAFYTNYRDMQLAQIYFIGTVQGNTILNAASSHIKGFEAEVTAVPFHGLTLTGSLAYLDAKYKNFIYLLPTGGSLDLSGQRLQNAPKWSGSMGATWEFPIGGLTGRLGAQYNYTSEKLLTSIIDTPRARVQPQHIVNINADLKFNEHLTLSAYATNLFDNRYINSVFDAPGTLGLTNYAPPRLFGIAANYKF